MAEPVEKLLGDDMAAIRARVLGVPGGTKKTTTKASKKPKLPRQIDLNTDVEYLQTHLEDPVLVSHMASARERLAEHEQKLRTLPQLEELRGKYLKQMGILSSQIRTLDDVVMGDRERVEVDFGHGRVLEELSAGVGTFYEKAKRVKCRLKDKMSEELRLAVEFCVKQAKEIAEYHEKMHAKLIEVKNSVFVLRREVVAVCDGLINLAEANDEDRRRLREYVALASSRRSGAPPGKQVAGLPGRPPVSLPTLPAPDVDGVDAVKD